MEKLTNREEDIMQVLWQLEKAFVKDLVAELPKSKPHYNTVSTIIHKMEDKGFVGHKAFGKTHQLLSHNRKRIVQKDLYAENHK